MDLFAHSAKGRFVGQPLAERMRPRTIDEFVGQGHVLAPGKMLAGLGSGRFVPSLILWGPPGSGKTTLAKLIGESTKSSFITLSAVESGVKDVREAIAAAAQRRDQYGTRTILFIDEIHRFSRAQQDALLPHVEQGTVTLIGATTENPSFGVIAALLSRCRVVRLDALQEVELMTLVGRALVDRERGFGGSVRCSEEVASQLVQAASGDARRLYSILEVAVAIAGGTAVATGAVMSDEIVLQPEHIVEAAAGRALLYDKAGDEHFGVISAFIKSLRGSDPDAAVYWMTRMIEAGEDPRFVLRRMIIFASEDIGNADPQALTLALDALRAYEVIGLPEAGFALVQAAAYLALSPKSNRALTAFATARKLVREHGSLPVPAKLRNASSATARQQGHGEDYKYPHDFAGAYVPEEYLPDQLIGTKIYEPSEQGYERALADRITELQARKARR